MGHYIYKSIPDAKFEVDSSFSFGDMTSQNFPQKKGIRNESSDSTIYPRKTGLTLEKRVFMCRIALLDPKLTSHVNFNNFQEEKNFFHFQNIWDISMTKEQQQPP